MCGFHESRMRAVLTTTLLLLVLALTPTAASAASIAYVDNGEVWLSSLDGTQKVRLATHVVNSEGKTEKWLDVAASDGGRIVAARNEPGKISRFSWFKVWEPNGTSAVEGPLNAPAGWSTYVYPLGFDITADGKHMVYGFSNSSSCCPITFAQGYYARPVTNSVLDPITISGEEDPTLFGNRVIAHAGATIDVQAAAAAPYGSDFMPWLDTSGTGLELRRTDIAANGQLAALELEQWNGGSQTIGKIAVLSIQGVDQTPTFPAAVDCFVPATGVATEVSLSADATRVAWTDGQGLRVAGTPTTSADPCALSSPPVVISPTGRHGAIGGANVSAFLPKAPGGGSPPGQPPGSPTTRRTRPVVTVPRKVTAKALAGRKGVAIKVRVARAGKVKISATVPAAVVARTRKPVVVATGSALARRAGTVTVRLRLTAAARKKPRRLKGARMTLRVSHGGLTTTKRVRVR
jgi:hypothetical protein